MARVLLVTPVFPPARGGIEAIAFRLATGMARHEVSVVALDEPGAAALDHDLRVPVARAPNEPRGGRGATIGLNRLAYATGRRTRPDVVLAMHVSATPAARALARLHGTATVLYVHAKEMRQLPYLAAAGARAADGVVAVSRYARALALDAGADPERVALIHPGVVLPAGPPLAPRAAVPTLVTVSRLEDRNKGHDLVLEALSAIRRAIPDVRWVVVGDGALRPALEAAAARAGLAGHVIFAGAVGDAERDRLLDEAWVFAMPTRRPADGRGGEGFGMVYAEAGAHGVPSVASRVPGVVDAVRDGETGLLVAPGDADAVADAAIALLGDRERRDRLGAAARERAQALAWERVLPAVEDVLERARANSRARRRPGRGAARAALWPLDLALPLTVRRPLAGTGPDLDA